MLSALCFISCGDFLKIWYFSRFLFLSPAEKSMSIASEIDIYSNHNLTWHHLDVPASPESGSGTGKGSGN